MDNRENELHPAVETLRQAADGLLFQSETDAPLTPFFWPDEGGEVLTPERALQFADKESDTPIKVTTVARFFRPATTSEEWHNEEEQAEVQKFKALVAALKAALKRPQVFRVGTTSIDVYIVGEVEGGYAGLQTRVVET